MAIWRISSNTALILPVLVYYADFGYLAAMRTLGEMGPAAKGAVPVLLNRWRMAGTVQQDEISTALKKIDPSTAAEAGIK